MKKQSIADSLGFEKEKEIEKIAHQSAMEKEKQQRYILYVSLVCFLLIGAFTFRGYQRKKKDNIVINLQKEEVEKQHLELEEVHHEMRDSINYAKRLQEAILPPLDLIKENLPQSFIHFKPKDIVSGDFYWFERINGVSYIAAADCTGHGVPGAMVSVVCSNALNRAVKEFNISEPAEILNQVRKLVIETFGKSGESSSFAKASENAIKDGMDIAMCAIHGSASANRMSPKASAMAQATGGTRKVTFAGANNPLWIVRKTALLNDAQKQERSTVIVEDLSLIEYKPDKQPIGLYVGMKEFTQQEIELQENDTMYIFTDGFADQFGGERASAGAVGGTRRGKKFKYKPFKRMLIELSHEPMEKQETIIDSKFEEWRGDLEQIDDVCIIGIRP